MNQTLFDSCGEFEISIRGGKSVTLRYPTDDQMARYQARVKIVTKRVGRDGTTTDIQGVEAAALELWEAIRVSGDDLDEFEAAYVVERLTTAEADEVEREGDDFRIHLDLIGGMRTSHLLRAPKIAEERKHDRRAISVIRRGASTEIKTDIRAFGDFYGLLAKHAEGYVNGAVPIGHKVAVVERLMREVRAAEQEPEPGN